MQQRSEETRLQLMQAARDQFARLGYDGASVEGICRSIGLSKGAFYYHFPSKGAIFHALLNEWLAGLDTQLQTFLSSERSVPEGLVQMAAVARQIFESAQGQLPMFLEFWREASHEPQVWQTVIDPYRRYTELFAGVVSRGVTEGSLRPVDPQLAARLIVALALGLILQGVMDPDGAAWEQVLPDSLQLLLQGLGRAAA